MILPEKVIWSVYFAKRIGYAWIWRIDTYQCIHLSTWISPGVVCDLELSPQYKSHWIWNYLPNHSATAAIISQGMKTDHKVCLQCECY